VTNEIIILVGASAYPLTTRDARWLIDRLRESYADTDDPHRKGAVALAWALELTLEGGEQEPLEFGLPQVEPVLDAMWASASAGTGLEPPDGGFMQPRGRNRRQSAANRPSAETAETGEW
jgi:hypothetical protein